MKKQWRGAKQQEGSWRFEWLSQESSGSGVFYGGGYENRDRRRGTRFLQPDERQATIVMGAN
jgi:hypothetical protein